MSPLGFDAVDVIVARRRLLWSMPAGIYVLGSAASARGPYHLMTHSLAVQAAVEPCVVAVSVERGSRTHGFIEALGACTLSVLRRDQRAIVRRFVKPTDSVELDAQGLPVSIGGVEVGVAPSGAPFIADAAGCLDLRVAQRLSFESHSLFCCEVTDVAASGPVLEGAASDRVADILRMEDTKMNYGG